LEVEPAFLGDLTGALAGKGATAPISISEFLPAKMTEGSALLRGQAFWGLRSRCCDGLGDGDTFGRQVGEGPAIRRWGDEAVVDEALPDGEGRLLGQAVALVAPGVELRQERE